MAIGEVKTLVFSDGVAVTAPIAAATSIKITDTTGWTGSQTTVTYDTSTLVSDARDMQWCLKTSAYKQILADISSADATHVTVTVDEPLAAGTYYLYGV